MGRNPNPVAQALKLSSSPKNPRPETEQTLTRQPETEFFMGQNPNPVLKPENTNF
jgi:hypothetical protein